MIMKNRRAILDWSIFAKEQSVPSIASESRPEEAERACILVASVHAQVLEFLRGGLIPNGYSVFCTTDGLSTMEAIAEDRADLLILDGDCPTDRDYQMCLRVRRMSSLPIILLSSKTEEEEIAKGFRQGADHYVTKPFGLSSLLARVETLLRRLGNGREREPRSFVSRNLCIEFDRCQVTVQGRPVKLSKTEYQLLSEMVRHRGKVLSPAQLLSRVWGMEYQEDIECLRTCIWRLRRKIEEAPGNPEYILTVPGTGYLFNSSS